MYCNHCGAILNPQQTTCAACGRPVPGAAVAPGDSSSRVARHIHLLAIFWFVVAALWLIPAVVLYVVGTGASFIWSGARPEAAMFGAALYLLGAGFLVIAAASFAAAWGLLKLRPWARTLALVLGFISLLHPPFGTALGIYTLWVLLPATAAAEYDRLAIGAA